MADLLMPRLSDSMEEATIISWLKQEGDVVLAGEELVEIETDKATVIYEAEDSGELHIVAGEGETVALGGLIATLGDAGTARSASAPGSAAMPAQAAAPVAPTPPAVPAADNGSRAARDGTEERVAATPVARRLARELQIDLGTLAGSGPRGRVTKRDVLAATPVAATAEAPAPPEPTAREALTHTVPATLPVTQAPPAEAPASNNRQQPLSRVQQVIAQRMSQSKATVPDFALNIEIDMEGASALRSSLRERQPDAAFSFNDLIVKACATALRRHPRANGSYRDGAFVLHEEVNVGIAVAAEDSLIVPVVKHADRKGLLEIAAESRRLAEAARTGAIAPNALAGGTFTVSNLGMFGVDSFSAIVNPPQAAILAVGAMAPRVVARDGAPMVRRCLTATLCCDHRILYGADAARFLAEIRSLLETPITMLL